MNQLLTARLIIGWYVVVRTIQISWFHGICSEGKCLLLFSHDEWGRVTGEWLIPSPSGNRIGKRSAPAAVTRLW